MFKDSLVAMGFAEERAAALTRDSARKLTILRRLIPSTAVATHPDSAAGENGKLLLPALLAGAWDMTFQGDRKALETLSGLCFEEFEALFPGWVFVGGRPASPCRLDLEARVSV